MIKLKNFLQEVASHQLVAPPSGDFYIQRGLWLKEEMVDMCSEMSRKQNSRVRIPTLTEFNKIRAKYYPEPHEFNRYPFWILKASESDKNDMPLKYSYRYEPSDTVNDLPSNIAVVIFLKNPGI